MTEPIDPNLHPTDDVAYWLASQRPNWDAVDASDITPHGVTERPRTAPEIGTVVAPQVHVPLRANLVDENGAPLDPARPDHQELIAALGSLTDRHNKNIEQREQANRAMDTAPLDAEGPQWGNAGYLKNIRRGVGRFFTRQNHPTELRGRALEGARQQYFKTAITPSQHAVKLFGGTEPQAFEKTTSAILNPELGHLQNIRLAPVNADSWDDFKTVNGLPTQQKSFTLAELLAHPDTQRPDGSHLGEHWDFDNNVPAPRASTDSTGAARTYVFHRPSLQGKPVPQIVNPMGALTVGMSQMHSYLLDAVDGLASHPAFNRKLVTDDNGNIINDHPDNLATFRGQREAVAKALGDITQATSTRFHGHGMFEMPSGNVRPIFGSSGAERSGGLPADSRFGGRQRGVVAGTDGNYYTATRVAVGPSRGTGPKRDVYHPARARFDAEGNILNPKEAALTKEEQDDMKISGGRHIPSNRISGQFRVLDSNIFDHPEHPLRVVDEQGRPDPERQAQVRSALQNVRVNEGTRSMIEDMSRPLAQVYDTSYGAELSGPARREDPTLIKALREHGVNFTVAPGAGSHVDPDDPLVDMMVPMVHERRKEMLQEERVKDLRDRAQVITQGKDWRRGRGLKTITKEVRRMLLPGSEKIHDGSIRHYLTAKQASILSDRLEMAKTTGREHYERQVRQSQGDVEWGAINPASQARALHEVAIQNAESILSGYKEVAGPSDIEKHVKGETATSETVKDRLKRERDRAYSATTMFDKEPYMKDLLPQQEGGESEETVEVSGPRKNVQVKKRSVPIPPQDTSPTLEQAPATEKPTKFNSGKVTEES